MLATSLRALSSNTSSTSPSALTASSAAEVDKMARFPFSRLVEHGRGATGCYTRGTVVFQSSALVLLPCVMIVVVACGDESAQGCAATTDCTAFLRVGGGLEMPRFILGGETLAVDNDGLHPEAGEGSRSVGRSFHRVIGLSVGRSVGWSVCLSGMAVLVLQHTRLGSRPLSYGRIIQNTTSPPR